LENIPIFLSIVRREIPGLCILFRQHFAEGAARAEGDIVRVDVMGTKDNYYCDCCRTAGASPRNASSHVSYSFRFQFCSATVVLLVVKALLPQRPKRALR